MALAPVNVALQSVVRVRFGSRSSKRAAKMLVDRLQQELGDVGRVVLRRNHTDEETDKVIVGLEYFDSVVQLCDEAVWTGKPGDDPADKQWMNQPTQLLAGLLVDLLSHTDAERQAQEGVGQKSELYGIMGSVLFGLTGVAYWYIMYD